MWILIGNALSFLTRLTHLRIQRTGSVSVVLDRCLFPDLKEFTIATRHSTFISQFLRRHQATLQTLVMFPSRYRLRDYQDMRFPSLKAYSGPGAFVPLLLTACPLRRLHIMWEDDQPSGEYDVCLSRVPSSVQAVFVSSPVCNTEMIASINRHLSGITFFQMYKRGASDDTEEVCTHSAGS